MKRQVVYLLAALVIYNVVGLVSGVHLFWTTPDKAVVHMSSDEVKVFHDVTAGSPSYVVTIPLTTFPFDLQLGQNRRYLVVFASTVNLILLAFLARAIRAKEPVKPFSVLRNRGAAAALGGP